MKLGYNILHLCSYFGKSKLVKQILNKEKGRMLINSLDRNNDTPAHLAAYRKHTDILLDLAVRGAFLDLPNSGNKDPITIISDKSVKRDFIEKALQSEGLNEKAKNHLKSALVELENEKEVTETEALSMIGSTLSPTMQRKKVKRHLNDPTPLNSSSKIEFEEGLSLFHEAIVKGAIPPRPPPLTSNSTSSSSSSLPSPPSSPQGAQVKVSSFRVSLWHFSRQSLELRGGESKEGPVAPNPYLHSSTDNNQQKALVRGGTFNYNDSYW